MSLADSLVASSSRPLGLKMRADLTARRQNYQGRSYWVVKEPIGLKYFRFQDEEFAVLNMMKEVVTLEEIKDRFEEEFAPHKITFQDLQQFIGTLHRSGLVISDASGQGPQLKKRRDERERKELLGKFSNILAVRWKGIDPDRLLRLLYPVTRWLFTKTAMVVFSMIGVAALLLISVQFDVFRSRLPEFDQFFGPKNWGYLALVLAVTKIIHEFGHGLLCHHFGGECHEMGVMLLVLTPCLYCNVSDSWMLPNKWHRAAIGAGGIYFELIMAAIATFVWWFTEPGMVNHLALRVMFICSVSTVIFNGNPLLRFDGYYILADILEIPNLRQKATKILQNKAGEVCLGLEMPEDPFLPQSNQAMFGLYTIAAVAYRWFVFLSIMFFLNSVFEPYGLKVVGQFIALMGLYGLIVQPIWNLGKFFHVPGRMDQVKWNRVGITALVVATVVLGILFLPVPRNVNCSLELKPAGLEQVVLKNNAVLREVIKKPGDMVRAGEVIARMENLQLQFEITTVSGNLESIEKQIELAGRMRSHDAQAASTISLLTEKRNTSRNDLELLKEEYREIEQVRAPVTGKIFGGPFQEEVPYQEGRILPWTGIPTDQKNLGLPMHEGQVFCEVGDPSHFEAILAVDQTDKNFVFVGQEVELMLDAFTDRVITAKIAEIPPEDLHEVSPAIANAQGGGLATKPDVTGEGLVPASTTYSAIVPISDERGEYRYGMRGRAKIHAGKESLWSTLWRYIVRTCRFDL